MVCFSSTFGWGYRHSNSNSIQIKKQLSQSYPYSDLGGLFLFKSRNILPQLYNFHIWMAQLYPNLKCLSWSDTNKYKSFDFAWSFIQLLLAVFTIHFWNFDSYYETFGFGWYVYYLNKKLHIQTKFYVLCYPSPNFDGQM